MTDDPSSSGPRAAAAPKPAGHGFRRAMTVDDASPLRRRPHLMSDTSSFEGVLPPRRSSNFSEYSLGEARDLLNPQPEGVQMASSESSSLASLSLAFALLPAISGVLFKNGSAVVTDVMLLGLAGVFLHWSVTQPWTWYHSAQEVRVYHETSTENVIEDDSEPDSPMHTSTTLDNVPEDEETKSEPIDISSHNRPSNQKQSALSELYVYEILALISCAALPLIGAYILHTIRYQLSRPSEGLVNNFNLTIFLLVAEMRVFLHMLKLIQARTLHLQRVVQGSSFGGRMGNNVEETLNQLLSRMERLESRPMTELDQGVPPKSSKTKSDVAITRDVRNAIQPDLDALNRAVRRYEKKATLLQFQTESRFSGFEARLDDAIALAATAAKNSASHKNVFVWTLESIVTMILLPFKAAIQILLLPLKTLLALVQRNKQKTPPAKTSRTSRNGKAAVQPRYSGDRVPTRVSKR
ncbi:Fc.00g109870.m01.CDS01 [Cosmosporella sp. VM-42]